jgi:chorismate dehydratase
MQSRGLASAASSSHEETEAPHPLFQLGLKVGAVSYLNSKPLVHGVPATRYGDSLFQLDYPSRLAEGLKTGQYDVALVPSIEYMLGGEQYEIVSNACVAARGPVLSVKVYFRKSPGDVKTLLLDEGSRTSAMLTKVILWEKYGVDPVSLPLPLPSSPWSLPGDAVLVIGDRAMYPPDDSHMKYGPFVETWDLGEEWLEWTGLPFVFAMWVARKNAPHLEQLSEILAGVRDLGVAQIPEIIAHEAPHLELKPELVERYLTKHLHYQMNSAERHGMQLYFQLAQGYLNRNKVK